METQCTFEETDEKNGNKMETNGNLKSGKSKVLSKKPTKKIETYYGNLNIIFKENDYLCKLSKAKKLNFLRFLSKYPNRLSDKIKNIECNYLDSMYLLN